MRDEAEQLEQLFEQGFNEPIWTLEQAIAWIAYRRPRVSGAVSDKSFGSLDCERTEEDQKYWHKMMAPMIHELEGIPKEDVREHLWSARAEITRRLQAGEITATWKWEGRERAAIAKLHWIDHSIICNEFDSLDVEGGNPRDGSLIRVDRKDVLKLWPAETSKLSDEKRATKLLKELVGQSLEKPTMARDDAIAWARTQVPSLGRQAGLRAWRAAVDQAGAEAWSKAGRRSQANRNGTPT